MPVVPGEKPENSQPLKDSVLRNSFLLPDNTDNNTDNIDNNTDNIDNNIDNNTDNDIDNR